VFPNRTLPVKIANRAVVKCEDRLERVLIKALLDPAKSRTALEAEDHRQNE
jgi:hypothetical protein